MNKPKRPRGRPVTAGATYLLKLPPELLALARAAAEREGITLAEWWRRAALMRLAGNVTT